SAELAEQDLSGLGGKYLSRRHPFQRHQIYKHRTRKSVDDCENRYAVHQCSRQDTFGIAYLSSELAQIPPAAEREERTDQAAGQRPNQWIRSRSLGHQRYEVGPIAKSHSQA